MGGHFDKSINIPLNDLNNQVTKIKSYKTESLWFVQVALEALKLKISYLKMG